MIRPARQGATGRNTASALVTALTLALGAQFALPGSTRAASGPWGLTREPGVTVYREPDPNSHPLARVVREADRVELLQGEGSWYKVRVGSVDGWVPTYQIRADFSLWQVTPAPDPTTVDSVVGTASITTMAVVAPPPGAETQVTVLPPDETPVATAPPQVAATASSVDNIPPIAPEAGPLGAEENVSPPVPVEDSASATAAPAVQTDAVRPESAPIATELSGGPGLRGRWRAGVVLGYGFLDREVDATLGSTTSTLGLDRHRYAGVRLGYGLTPWLELELGAVYDWYRWDVANSLSPTRDSEFSAFTLTFGPLFYGPRRSYGWLGTGAFFAQGALAYRDLDADLDYPVRDYDPALGVQLAVGYEWRAVQVRLGYSRQSHSAGSTESGARPGGDADPLDLSAVFFDVTYSVRWRP